MKACRECQHQVSEQAMACPNCGAPRPSLPTWDGWGYEYKSGITLLGVPLVHISFKYRPNRRPVVARGVIAIGQFACGLVTISQFGIGLISISQFTIAGLALAQFAVAYSLIAQIGLYINEGHGQMVVSLADLLRQL
ncbi:MAG: zinc ribbon domain-containing protein [Kiritimatiellaeota bacterium]|nr:zinc ribbon domain-containing protein [Kiritimatiellota bacterium]